MPAHQDGADACWMHMRNYATELPAVAGLTGNGSSFTVTWQAPEIQMQARPSSCPVPSITDRSMDIITIGEKWKPSLR